MRRSLLTTFVLAAALVTFTGQARADQRDESSGDEDPPTPAPPPRATEKRFYGWQILATDIAAQAMGFALAKDTEYAKASPLLVIPGGPPLRALFDTMTHGVATVEWVSLGTYLFAAPLVHLANGRPKTMLYSLGLRVLAPTGLAAAGFVGGLGLGAALCVAEDCSNDDVSAPLILGAVFGVLGAGAGYLGAIAVDAGMLAIDERPRANPSTSASTSSAIRLAPLVEARRAGAIVGIGGTF